MVHFGKTQPDELQIIISGDDIESLHRMILSANLTERPTFHKLKEYIEDNFTKHQQY